MARRASKTEKNGAIEKVFESADASASEGNVRTFGYARVSTADQTTHLQIDALIAAGVPRECIVEETGSGYAVGARPLRDALLAKLQPGDELVIWRLDRLGRSLSEIVSISERLTEQGISLRSITDGVDPKTPAGKMLLGILGSMAEYERNLIAERTKAGLKAARRRGAKLGRPSALTPRGLDIVLTMTEAGRTVDEIADGLGVSKSTVDRARRKLRETGKLT